MQISAGRERSVALTRDGSAYAWGSIKRLGATLPPDYPGELCTSNSTEIGHNRYAQPEPQLLNPDAPFSAVCDSRSDTLGVAQHGGIVACRPVVSPEVGAAKAAVALFPSKVVHIGSTDSAIVALCADGSVWSWGVSANGQLGRVSSGLMSPPAMIAGVAPIARVAAGGAHLIALDRDGKVWSWGANAVGQLGLGNLSERSAPVNIKFPVRVTQVAAGDTHSFAVDESGQLWAWGANNFGQLGELVSGVVSARYTSKPLRIETGFAVSRIDAGMFYTVAVSTQGDVFAWGWNGMGQLGVEGVFASARPLRIKGLSNVRQIAAGQGHVLVEKNSEVFAWGDNRASACGVKPSVKVQIKPFHVVIA